MTWAILRQLVLASQHAVTDGERLATALRLPPGFADPELAAIDVADYVMPVGAQKFLEVVGPLSEHAYLQGWLNKVGGAGGYCLSVQVPDVAACAERAARLGIRVPVDTVVMGHRLVQLHPADTGILLELDGIADPNQWYWDDVSPGPRADATIDDIVAVRVGVPDPAATTAQWAELIGLTPVSATELDFSGCRVEFVERNPAQLIGATFRLSQGVPAPDLANGLDMTFEYVPVEEILRA